MIHIIGDHGETPAESIAHRPVGVAAIVALLFVVSATALGFALLVLLQLLPLSYGSILLPNGFEQSGPIAFAIYAVICGLLAIGLWRRFALARRLTVLLAVAGIVFVVPGISSAVVDGRFFAIVRDGLQIIVRVAIVYYLSQEPVRDWFSYPPEHHA